MEPRTVFVNHYRCNDCDYYWTMDSDIEYDTDTCACCGAWEEPYFSSEHIDGNEDDLF